MLIPKLPVLQELVDELRQVREKGLLQLGELQLRALVTTAKLVVGEEVSNDRARAEPLLRRAIGRLGGGRYGEAASLLFGLGEGTRDLTAGVRRTLAAERLGVSVTTFRKKRETPLLEDIATQVLTLCSEQHARDAHNRRERTSPVESTMAVKWLERFEAYYRIWTPVWSLGADLTAYRYTLFEPGRPYDRRFGTRGADDEGYSQEEQAEGYARDALYHYARFEWELKQFITRNGGLWLASDAETEQALADAVYRVWFHTPWNERDQSFLRTVIAETPDQELHGFIERLAVNDIGRITHQEWQDWVATCECTSDATVDVDEYFPTSANHDGISNECELHQVVAACGDYCTLVDADWRKVADWYHLDAEIGKGVRTEDLYREQLERRIDR